MLVSILLLLFPLAISPSSSSSSSADADAARGLFARFKKDYGRTYASQSEEERRFRVFQSTLSRVRARNMDNRGGGHPRSTAVHGITQFADMTPRELPTPMRASAMTYADAHQRTQALSPVMARTATMTVMAAA